MDEHVWAPAHAGPRRRTGFATGIVDLTPGRAPRLLDVVPGRTGKAYAAWIGDREQDWRERNVPAEEAQPGDIARYPGSFAISRW